MHVSGDNGDDAMIELQGVGKTYPDGTVAVGSLDLDVPRGALVALVGPSGCGKSTTLKMVNRLIEPTSGRILLDGDDGTGSDPGGRRRARRALALRPVGNRRDVPPAGRAGLRSHPARRRRRDGHRPGGAAPPARLR